MRELLEGAGCELIYLPAYSPDLNPIEEAFSKVKHILRKIAARTKEALVEAMGAALDAVSAEDARGFFAHCGYHAPAQQLSKTLLVLFRHTIQGLRSTKKTGRLSRGVRGP